MVFHSGLGKIWTIHFIAYCLSDGAVRYTKRNGNNAVRAFLCGSNVWDYGGLSPLFFPPLL
jgi:hypothetical protein